MNTPYRLTTSCQNIHRMTSQVKVGQIYRYGRTTATSGYVLVTGTQLPGWVNRVCQIYDHNFGLAYIGVPFEYSTTHQVIYNGKLVS